MKNGQQIDVDLMTETHLRNTLKMILRNIERAEQKQSKRQRFKLNGEMAQGHVDQGYLSEYEDFMNDELNFLGI